MHTYLWYTGSCGCGCVYTAVMLPTLFTGPGWRSSPANTLLVQASKVIAAHAAGSGDVMLSVPLHVCAGLPAEAVTSLQVCALCVAHAQCSTCIACVLSVQCAIGHCFLTFSYPWLP